MKNDKTTKYFSKNMEERRKTVLRTARRLIGEDGIDGFTMKQLARAAGVSGATLFNIYGNRENLVSEAVLDAFNTSMGDGVSSAPETLNELIRYIEWTHKEIIKLGNYIPVIVNAYFSSARENRIREILLSEASAPYIYFLQKHGNSEIVTNANIATNFWRNDLQSDLLFDEKLDVRGIDSLQLERKLKTSVFTLMIPVVKEPIRKELTIELRNSLK